MVRLAVIPEVTYGVTPGAGNFQTARFINESLSGTPDTVESQQIRTDRMSSGQIVTGLQVGGEIGFELAKETMLEDFMASAMYQSAWNSVASVTLDFDIDATAKTLTRAAGSFITDGLVIGDFIKLAGFASALNNVTVMITGITALEITFIGPDTMITATGTGTSYRRFDKLSIGTTKKSFSIEKAFLDLTEKAILYRGMIVSEMNLTVAFGSLISGSFTLSGNDYLAVDDENDFMTFGRTINPPATTGTLNGSVDMPFVASSAVGALGPADLGINSVEISLNNNLSAQNVIGDIAPIDYSAGTAAIEINLSAYLTDAAWPILAKKLTQEAFALGFMVQNLGGAFGFYMPQVQVSFEDPASAGQNQDILLDMSGFAKVGATGESALTIYRSN